MTISPYHPWRHGAQGAEPTITTIATYASQQRARTGLTHYLKAHPDLMTTPGLFVGTSNPCGPFPNMQPGVYVWAKLLYTPTIRLEYVLYTAEYADHQDGES